VSADYRARGADVPPERLVLTAGTSEAYSFLFRLLADPGDAVLVPAPSYPLFELLGRINDVTLVHYPLAHAGGFGIDLEALDRAAKAASPRALLIVSPANPTGTFLKRREMEALDEICARGGIPIICDEVFGDYALREDPGRVTTLAGRDGALTFVLNGLSKMLALPQLKLGWIAVSGPAGDCGEAMRRLEVIADTFLSVNTPAQTAAGDLLALRSRIQPQILERVADNRAWLESAAERRGSCRCLPAEGGWYAILEVPRTRSDEQWALLLLQEEGILTHPGYLFDFPTEGRLVVSLLPPPEIFREAANRLITRVAAAA
jgi:aspartate/methionine/tyrosine aminotransferase